MTSKIWSETFICMFVQMCPNVPENEMAMSEVMFSTYVNGKEFLPSRIPSGLHVFSEVIIHYSENSLKKCHVME